MPTYVPRNELQVHVRDIVASKVLLSGLGQVQVDDGEHTLDLVAVTLNGRGDVLLGVELLNTLIDWLFTYTKFPSERPTKVNQAFCPKYGPWPELWKCSHCFS
jgi:hypothetical protein